VVHQSHKQIVEGRRVGDKQQIVGVPPTIKNIGSCEEPYNPERGFAKYKEAGQHNEHKDKKWKGMEEHVSIFGSSLTRCRQAAELPNPYL
jgi:hypothetical protein